MKKAFFLLCAVAISFCSCSPKIHKTIAKKLPPLDNAAEVTVYDIDEIVPENVEVIGGVSVVDGGFTTHCDWETVIETAKQEARAAGGNGVEILQHSYPGQNGSNCHQMVGFILNVSDDIEPVELSEMAQQNFHDYVVVKEGDTLPCSIKDESNSHLGFIYERHGIRRFSRLPKSSILDYHINDPVALAEQIAERNKKQFHVRIGLDGGYAFRTAKMAKGISGDYKDYLRKLSRGLDVGASIRFNVIDNITLGLHYDRFSKGQQADVYGYSQGGNYVEGSISNIHTINFIAGSFGMLALTSNKRHGLYYDFLFGYMDYTDVAEELGHHYTLTGKTFGLGLDFGYDYLLTKHLAIGAEFSYYSGSMSKFKFDDGFTTHNIDLGKSKEGLQRVNLKAGIRYYF